MSEQSAMVRFNFQGDELDVFPRTGKAFVSVRRVCEALGVDFSSQLKKLKSDPSAGVVMIATPSEGGVQTVACVEVRKLPLWMATIHPNKVRPELTEKLLAYKEEASDVLADHFIGRRLVVPPSPPPPPPSRDEALDAAQREKAHLLLQFVALMSPKMAAECKDVVAAHAVSMLTGTRLAPMLPELNGRWKRPTEIAKEVGESVARVGKAIAALDLKNQEPRRKVILDKKMYGQGHVECFLYDEEAVAMIADWLRANPVKATKKKAA